MQCTLEDLVEQKYCALNKTMEKEMETKHATITLMKQPAAGTMQENSRLPKCAALAVVETQQTQDVQTQTMG